MQYRRSDLVEVYRDTARKWRWRHKAGNGQIIADSGQGYTLRRSAIRAARRAFRVGIVDAPKDKG